MQGVGSPAYPSSWILCSLICSLAYNGSQLTYIGTTAALQLRLRDLGKMYPYNKLLPAMFDSQESSMHMKVRAPSVCSRSCLSQLCLLTHCLPIISHHSAHDAHDIIRVAFLEQRLAACDPKL